MSRIGSIFLGSKVDNYIGTSQKGNVDNKNGTEGVSQLSVIGAVKVSHFEILCRVYGVIPTVGEGEREGERGRERGKGREIVGEGEEDREGHGEGEREGDGEREREGEGGREREGEGER
ncbi:hypothetical protein Tco_1340530 [Tanacetum coccineum]